MSGREQARRTDLEVVFGGTDITASMRPYLLSLTYTDNEEDEADDLQIKLQDRDGIWMTQWLNDAVQAAATSAPATGEGNYCVTAQSGLNVRAGPATSYQKIGSLVYGTTLTVHAIENGWAKCLYSGKTGYVSASYLQPSADKPTQNTGMRISAVIIRKNWNSDGADRVLDCGEFELDTVSAAEPPATVTIKGTALPYHARVRQTKRSGAWEACRLSRIARDLSERNGMACLYESADDPLYERMEQFQTSDIDFLSQLCHDAGISLKVTNNMIVLFDAAAYEQKCTVRTIKRGDGTYTKCNLTVGKADTQYASCRVRYADPVTGQCIEGISYAEDYQKDGEGNQQLEVTAKVSSIGEAQKLAEKRLRLHNKYARMATFTMPGDPAMVAGTTVLLEGWGMFDGKYMIKQAKHTVDGVGYTVQVMFRRVLEGY